MMKRLIIYQIVFSSVAVLIVSSLVQAEEIQKEAVPPAVIAAFEKSYPAATIKSYEKEERSGEICYEIESIEGTIERDIVYNKRGDAMEIEESLDVNQLPDRVRKSIENKNSKEKILSAEKVIQGAEITYELVVQRGEKKIEVVVDQYGGVISSKTKEHD